MSQQPEYFGGTPTSKTGYRPPKPKSQSVVSSIWNDFTENSPIDDVVGGAVAGLLKGAAAVDEYVFGNAQPGQDFAAGVTRLDADTRAAAAGVSEESRRQMGDALVEEYKKSLKAGSGLGTSGPLALTAKATEDAWSYGVARPLSTGALLANPESPLYKEGTVEQIGPSGETEIVPTEQGFQLSDVQQAWNRSADVSFAQAAVANPIVQTMDPGLALLNSIGGIDQYDPWSVSDMADAQDNPFYKFLTGGTDAALQFAVPSMTKIARLAAMERLGLTTTIRSGDDLARYAADYERYRAGDTANNTYGDMITELADETNIGRIQKHPLVATLHGMDKNKVARLLQRTSDPDTVNQLMLAARGDVDAMKQLFDAAPDHVWGLADLNDTLRQSFMRGERYMPTGDAERRVLQVFDAAIDRDEYFTEVKRMFASEGGFSRAVESWMPTRYNEVTDGPAWTPLVNWLSKTTNTVVEKTRDKAGKISYAITESDYERAPQWLSETTDSFAGQPVTRFVHWVGSRQPLGTVSRSGLRPDDLWIELKANMDQVPIFRGTKPIKVDRVIGPDGVERDVFMSPAQYRDRIRQRVTEGIENGNLQATWQAAEDDMLRVMADNVNGQSVDPARVQAIAAGYRSAMDESFSYMQNNNRGYLWDEQGQNIRLSADSRRALVDSFPTLPIGELYRGLLGELNPLLKGSLLLDDLGEQVFDAASKYFRVNVLFRFGYIPKNSVGEPLIASALAHGTWLTDEGIAATLGNVAGNMRDRGARFLYATRLMDLAKVGKGKAVSETARQIALEKQNLIQQREGIRASIENMKALHDTVMAGEYGPTVRAQYQEEIRGNLVDAQILLNNIEDALDQRMPEWRQIVEPANLTDLNLRLRELRAVTGQDDGFARILRDELKDINEAARDRARAASPRARTQKDLDRIQAQIDGVDKELVRLSTDYNRPKIDKTDVSVARNQEDDIARGRDYQAIALQRQRTSLVAQRDDILERLNGMPDDDAFDFTPNESGRKQHIEGVLARIDSRRKVADDGTVVPTDPKIVEKIQTLQNLYDDIVRSYETPVIPFGKKLEELERELDAVDAALRSVQVRQGEAVSKIQAVRGIRAYRGSGNGMTYVWIGDQRVAVPASFSDRAYDFGPGYRAEASAAVTANQTFDPSYYAGQSMLRWKLTGGARRVTPLDPTYWKEVEHVANRIFRSEPLIQRILEAKPGTERQVAAKWLVTPEGRRYQKSMGRDYLEVKETRATGAPLPNVDSGTLGRPRSVLLASTTDLDDVIRLVQQYFPDPRVRELIASREVEAGELQRLMGGRTDLKDVIGNELQFQSLRPFAQVNDALNRALEKIWQWASADIENRVARWPFFVRQEKMELQRRINVLKSQGVDLTADDVRSLRQGAARAALVELEKTFYNIRRYSSPVYASRFLIGFPGAFFNSYYRYGRFAVKQPERTFIAAQLYGNMLEHMGVDEQGNPTGSDIRKAKYLVVPGTRRQPGDAGLRIPVASFEGLAIGLPGLSWLSTMLVSALVSQNPTAEDLLKQRLGDTYNQVFPYGIPRDPRSVLLGAYQKDLLATVASVDGFEGATDTAFGVSDEKFITVSTQIYADAMARWERDGSDPKREPTFEGAAADARAYLLTSAFVKNINPVATNRPVAGQLMRDEWYSVRAAFGPEREQEARQYFIEKYGDWARWYTQSGSKKTAYIPATQEAFKRVYQDFPDLAADLYSQNVDDPSMVSLLTIGTGGEFSEAVSNFLRTNPLPGDDNTVYSRLTPAQFANEQRTNDGWGWYNRNKAKYEAERTRVVTLRDNAPDKLSQASYRQYLAKIDKSWSDKVDAYKATNMPWALDFGDPGGQRADKAARYMTMILKDRKFFNGPGQAPVWRAIDQFLYNRDQAKAALANETSTDAKQQIKDSFVTWVNDSLIKNNPEFGGVFDRYFASEWVDR